MLGDEHFLDVLLENGADLSRTDKDGLSVVHFAALNRNIKNVIQF